MYDKTYDKKSIRTENRDFVNFLLPYLRKNDLLVDLGCGTCRKVVLIAPHVHRVDGMDRSQEMIEQAKISLVEKKIENVRLFYGDNYNTPFPSRQYDVASTALSVWSPSETHRLLKPNGLFFIETLCSDDKKEMKEVFGDDELGSRGYLCSQTREERTYYLLAALEPFFDVEEYQFTERETTLSAEGFIGMLQVTPTIRGFSLEKDGRIIQQLLSNGEITFIERRMMIRARAKDIAIKKEKTI